MGWMRYSSRCLALAARRPANKIAVAGIQPLAVRRLFNGLDALQFADG